MSNNDKLKQLYKEAAELEEENPLQLMQKLSKYGQILELIGGFHAQALNEWKLAEAIRRETIASAYSYSDGTVADKTNTAEVAGAEARKKEGKAESEALRWKNAFTSVQEQIQIMKKRYDNLKEVNRGNI